MTTPRPLRRLRTDAPRRFNAAAARVTICPR